MSFLVPSCELQNVLHWLWYRYRAVLDFLLRELNGDISRSEVYLLETVSNRDLACFDVGPSYHVETIIQSPLRHDFIQSMLLHDLLCLCTIAASRSWRSYNHFCKVESFWKVPVLYMSFWTLYNLHRFSEIEIISSHKGLNITRCHWWPPCFTCTVSYLNMIRLRYWNDIQMKGVNP